MSGKHITSNVFTGCYSIDTKNGPSLQLHLVFSANSKAFTGSADLTPSPEKPLTVIEQVTGLFHMIPTPGGPFIGISGKGYSDIHWPQGAGIGPVLPPILDFRLSTSWPSPLPEGESAEVELGIGQFRYRFDQSWSNWFEGNVEPFPCFTQ